MIVKNTPHIEITNTEDLADTVLMPGDPLRAKYVADTYLLNVKQVNGVRGMLGFTGTYNGKRITVMASGMGQPSIGIYSYELFHFYGVKNIVRIGSAGAYNGKLDLFDTFLVTSAYSESTFAKVAYGINDEILYPSDELNDKLRACAKKLGIHLKEGRTHSSDVFYHDPIAFKWQEVASKYDLDCVEMESFALFANAKYLGKNAACLLSISDSFVTSEATTSLQRQVGFNNMIKVALELAMYD